MINAVLDTNNFAEKIKIFSSGLGNIFQDLLKTVGDKMTAEARANAPVNTGNLKKNIKFLINKKDIIESALTTKKSLNKSNVWYSNIREHGANIEYTGKSKNHINNPNKIKNGEYLMFKINGEWKKVKSVKTPAQPFAKNVFNDYFGSDTSKGYEEIANALLEKIEASIK